MLTKPASFTWKMCLCGKARVTENVAAASLSSSLMGQFKSSGKISPNTVTLGPED